MIQPVLLIINTSREPIIPSKNSIASETRLRLRRITFLAFLLLLWCLLSVEQRLLKKHNSNRRKKRNLYIQESKRNVLAESTLIIAPQVSPSSHRNSIASESASTSGGSPFWLCCFCFGFSCQ